MFNNSWLQYVKVYQKKHPEFSYKEVLQKAAVSYRKLKKQRGGEVKSKFIRDLPCFKDGLADRGESLVKKYPFKFIIRKSNTNVSLKVPTTLRDDKYEIIEVLTIVYQKYLDDDIVRLNRDNKIENKQEINRRYDEKVMRESDRYEDEKKQMWNDITIECLIEKILFDHLDGKVGNILCVHTSHGFCTKKQETFYDTIGEFIYSEMRGTQRDYMTAYGHDTDYTVDQRKFVKVKEGISRSYE